MGSSTEHSAFGPTRNPWDLDRIPGGSGGGSAAAVAAFEAPLALGTDTGGSIRQPGAVTGIVGVKPTYGGVSRYGAIAMASSLDQIGPVSRTVLDSALLHQVIGGHDPRDSTSLPDPLEDLVAAARTGNVEGMKIGIIKELHGEGYQAGVENRFNEAARTAQGRRRRDRRGLLPQLQVRPGRLLPDHALRGLLQPGQVRRRPVRPAGAARRGPADDRTRHGCHPRRRLRRRGQAPHHPGHLRPQRRLLRRLLRLGAEGPHPDPARLRRRVRRRPTC